MKTILQVLVNVTRQLLIALGKSPSINASADEKNNPQ